MASFIVVTRTMFSHKLEPVLSLCSGSSVPWGIGVGSAIAIATMITPAQAASLTSWSFDPSTNLLEVTVKDGTQPRYFVMAQPARIVLDLPGTSIAGVKTQASYGGAVRQVRVSQFQPGVTRIVMELAPDTRLASGQVNLQKLEETSSNSRWVLRPLLADSTTTATRSTPQPANSDRAQSSEAIAPPTIAPSISVPPPLAVAPNPAVTPATALPPTPSSAPAASPPVAPPTTEPPQPPIAIVPPALPSTTTPPIAPEMAALIAGSETAAIVPPALPTSSNPAPLVSEVPAPIAGDEAAALVPPVSESSAPVPLKGEVSTPPASVPQDSPVSPNPTTLFPTAAAPASLEIPSTLPTAPATPTIAVPSISESERGLSERDLSGRDSSERGFASPGGSGSSVDLVPTQAQSLQTATPLEATSWPASVSVPPLSPASSVPPAIAPSQPAPTVSVPPLQSESIAAPTTVPAAPISAPPSVSPAIEFGQPLPEGQALRSSSSLTAGALLSLRYPGTASLKLRPGTPQQEVLLLHSEIRDEAGNVFAPKDSMVIGRFETDQAGSRFVAQAISLQGRSMPLVAQSDVLAGNLKPSNRNLAVNSGIGAIAGGLIGGFSGAGVAGGAAVGAAATLLTSPKPATVQPGQIVQIRLLQDLR